MDERWEEPEYVPISRLNAYSYCPRRFYYEVVLAEMIVNEHVLEGELAHHRVDQPGYGTRGEKLQLRRVYLAAPVLGLIGYCDLVEAEGAVGDDLRLLALAGKLYPVEYKKGKLGKWVNDQVQLCAQALALEETLAVPVGSIGRGYLYYFGSARRDEVELGLGLRQQTLTLLAEAKLVATLPQPPPPIDSKRKCRDCSLEPLCLPREVLAMRAGKVRRDGDLLSD